MAKALDLTSQTISAGWLIDRLFAVMGELSGKTTLCPELQCYLVDLRERLVHLPKGQLKLNPLQCRLQMLEAIWDYNDETNKYVEIIYPQLPDLADQIFNTEHREFGRVLKRLCRQPMSKPVVH